MKEPAFLFTPKPGMLLEMYVLRTIRMEGKGVGYFTNMPK
jgi:hypothetical protein